MNLKVIHIMPTSLSRLRPDLDFRTNEIDWYIVFAKMILKRTKDYEMECWRPERKLKEVYTTEKDGIIYRLFPSSCIPLPGLKAFEFSIPLLRELKRKSKKEKLILHLYSPHNPHNYIIAFLFKNVPIILTHLGGIPRFYSLRYVPEKIVYKNIDCLIPPPTEVTFKRMASLVGKDKLYCQPFGFGIDFDLFKPIDKIEARRKLNLPLNKKIMIYVGRYYKLKGVDIILKTFKRLKEKYDIELLLIGGLETDPFFEEAKKEGARVLGFVDNRELPWYYSAADVYVYPAFRMHPLELGIAPLECLACGTPVVGTGFSCFPHLNLSEIKNLGKIPVTPDDVEKCVTDIFENQKLYRFCRETAQKYFDRENFIKGLITKYNELSYQVSKLR